MCNFCSLKTLYGTCIVTVTSNYLADISTTLTLKEKVLSWVTHGHFYTEYGIQKHEIQYVWGNTEFKEKNNQVFPSTASISISMAKKHRTKFCVEIKESLPCLRSSFLTASTPPVFSMKSYMALEVSLSFSWASEIPHRSNKFFSSGSKLFTCKSDTFRSLTEKFLKYRS